jgi:hypothetical protein
LIISAPPELNSYTHASGLTVQLENLSAHEIEFLPDESVRLYWKDGDDWQSVRNLVANSVPRKIILGPRDVVENNTLLIWVSPDVPPYQPANVRVEVQGRDLVTNRQIRVSVEATLTPP